MRNFGECFQKKKKLKLNEMTDNERGMELNLFW